MISPFYVLPRQSAIQYLLDFIFGNYLFKSNTFLQSLFSSILCTISPLYSTQPLPMKVFRSTRIQKYSTLVPYQTAFETVSKLISLGYIQIELYPEQDPKNVFFTILSRIRSLRNRVQKMAQLIQVQYGIPLAQLSNTHRRELIMRLRAKLAEKKQDFLKYLDHKQEKIDREFRRVDELSINYQKIKAMLQQNWNERDIVKGKINIYRLNHPEGRAVDYEPGRGGISGSNEFSLITGVCSASVKGILERLVFRASRGHSYIVFKERSRHDRDIASEEGESVVIFIFVPGSSDSLLQQNYIKTYNHKIDSNTQTFRQKIRKICVINNVTCFDVPDKEENLIRYLRQLEDKETEIKALLEVSERGLFEAISKYCRPESEPKIIKTLVRLKYLERIAFILCHQKPTASSHFLLNFFKPLNQPDPENLILYESKNKITSETTRTCMPRLPFLYESNLLTSMFAIPRHDEINPSIFVAITLPILFGMMFSDVGHGTLLLIMTYALGLGKIWYLMGFMSVYFGALFNEFFGMKIPLFFSITGGRFGVNPVWGTAQNSLAFQNSLKMKLSIIIGAVHMVFGFVLKIVNDRYQRKYTEMYFESIPKMILMLCSVGYMVFLIIFKWTINFSGHTATAPSIISMILEMYLGYHSTRTVSLYSSIDRQKQIASFLKTVMCVCLLLIMIGKSVYQKLLKFNPKSINYTQLKQDDPQLRQENLEQEEVQSEEAQHFGPLEAFQFVLSLISSITSYLRLFALSLSHQKLSHLLLSFFLGSLKGTHPSISLLRSVVFFSVTVMMMMMLDVMECLMHVIRLHWVQWMGKFFKGGGKQFVPQIEGEY